MRAVAIDEFGGREKLVPRELPEPKVPPDGVLVRLEAAALNPVDWKIREGRLQGAFPHVFPVVLGWDAAGVVERVGPAVRGVEPGDEVFAYCRKHFVGEGTYAEYASVPEDFCAPKPRSLDFLEAAAVPLAGLTAFQALVQALALKEGETVLIHAAAGGVGSFAVQIAAALGAHVIGTASAARHEYLRGLGAAETLDYREQDVVEAVRATRPDGVDAVFDLIGGETQARSAEVLRRGGRLVSIAQPPDRDAFAARGIEAGYVFVRPSGDDLRELGRLADEGRLRVHLERVLPLEQVAEAHELLEQGHVQGKIALQIAD